MFTVAVETHCYVPLLHVTTWMMGYASLRNITPFMFISCLSYTLPLSCVMPLIYVVLGNPLCSSVLSTMWGVVPSLSISGD